jgi:ankyrin repeat protein
MLKLLLSFDIDIYQKDYTGKNVIDYCLENNNFEFLKILEENNI